MQIKQIHSNLPYISRIDGDEAEVFWLQFFVSEYRFKIRRDETKDTNQASV